MPVTNCETSLKCWVGKRGRRQTDPSPLMGSSRGSNVGSGQGAWTASQSGSNTQPLSTGWQASRASRLTTSATMPIVFESMWKTTTQVRMSARTSPIWQGVFPFAVEPSEIPTPIPTTTLASPFLDHTTKRIIHSLIPNKESDSYRFCIRVKKKKIWQPRCFNGSWRSDE